jgi:hypothetical protein
MQSLLSLFDSFSARQYLLPPTIAAKTGPRQINGLTTGRKSIPLFLLRIY